MKLKKIVLLFNTIKYLTFSQLYYNVVRRLISVKPSHVTTEARARGFRLVPCVEYPDKLNNGKLHFLNVELDIEKLYDWRCESHSKLWRYNLHYFDYLLDPQAEEDVKDRLISEWIKHADALEEDAWEPYTTSLRIVNWIKYFVIYKDDELPSAWLRSLQDQAQTLYRSIEYHILANHYLKNGKALVFAGHYLDCEHSERWCSTGIDIVMREIDEQILSDGGHYEKSPMYHSIVVEDYLDLYNVLDNNDTQNGVEQCFSIREKLQAMLEFMNTVKHPDGDIPLFNDSAHKIAPLPAALSDYASRLFDYSHSSDDDGVSTFSDTGYVVIKHQNDAMIIDCGAVGPSYQPGHTHNDTLSYELTIDNQRLVVDTGVYEYVSSEQRRYSRSTKAHNTVSIDGQEQSEIWGVFRVARRSSGVEIMRSESVDGTDYFTGRYSPYWNKTITHTREIEAKHDRWSVSDHIDGEGGHHLENYIHIHPDVSVKLNGSVCLLTKDNVSIADISVGPESEIVLQESEYYPEFGITKKNTAIVISQSCVLPASMIYVITCRDAS